MEYIVRTFKMLRHCASTVPAQRAGPVNRSVHALLANQHTVSASDIICVNVYKMCIKGQPC